MRGIGFEPTKALSHRILSPAHLTTLEPPHKSHKKLFFLNLLLFDYFNKLFKTKIFIKTMDIQRVGILSGIEEIDEELFEIIFETNGREKYQACVNKEAAFVFVVGGSYIGVFSANASRDFLSDMKNRTMSYVLCQLIQPSTSRTINFE